MAYFSFKKKGATTKKSNSFGKPQFICRILMLYGQDKKMQWSKKPFPTKAYLNKKFGKWRVCIIEKNDARKEEIFRIANW